MQLTSPRLQWLSLPSFPERFRGCQFYVKQRNKDTALFQVCDNLIGHVYVHMRVCGYSSQKEKFFRSRHD